MLANGIKRGLYTPYCVTLLGRHRKPCTSARIPLFLLPKPTQGPQIWATPLHFFFIIMILTLKHWNYNSYNLPN